MDLLTPIKLNVFRDTVKDRKIDLLKEQKSLSKDLKFLEESILKFEKYLQDKKLMKQLSEIDSVLETLEENEVRYSREIRKFGHYQNKVQKNIEHQKYQITKTKEKIDKVNKQYDLIKNIPDTSIVAKWEEDANCGSFLKDFVNEFEKDGRVVVLEKITD
jgi:predicted  nucleic acid-binding Zn-ribbon protein